MAAGMKASELAVLRYKQVDSLRQYFPTVKEVQKDALYEVPVLLPTKTNITIRITLGSNFPNVPPSLRVSPAVSHRLIDSNMNIKAEASSKLQQWHPAQNLGKTMYSIVQKLMQEPPSLGGGSAGGVDPQLAAAISASMAAPSSMAGGAVAYAVSSSDNAYNNGGAAKAASSSSVSVPPIPDSFPELQSMKPAQLGELLNDDAAFRKYLLSMDSVRNMMSLRNELRASQSGGEDTAKLDAEIEAAREELDKEKKALAVKSAQQEKLMSKLQVSNLVEALSELANKSEEESEVLSRQFLDGDIDIKAFQRDFVAVREVFHLRSAKKESLIIKQQREKK